MRLLYIAFLMPWALIFNSCTKIEPLPKVDQPTINHYSEKDTIVVGDTTIITGAPKDYEQGSDVVFRLTVKSNSNLKKFSVTTTSDAVSNLSKTLRTEPPDAIDISGNFIKNLNNVVVYYEYHIDDLVPPLSVPVVSFNFQNQMDYTSISYTKFTVIKKGSTNGKRLTIIDLPWANRFKSGIGCQVGLDFMIGYRSNTGLIAIRGPFFSLAQKADMWQSSSSITDAENVDLVGYIFRAPSLSNPEIFYNNPGPPVTAGPFFYLVSPSDTTLLGYKYAGAEIARITLAGTATTGNQVKITVNGVTGTATYATSTTVTATNFVNTYKTAYAAVGIKLQNTGFGTSPSASATLQFIALNDNVGFDKPTTVISVGTGGMYGNDQLTAIPPNGVYGGFTWTNLACNINMRQTVRKMAANLASKGKKLRVAYYKRLDNSTDHDQLSVADFATITHDNEFDKYLGPTLAAAKTYGGPVDLNQVWGFVLDDGRRGLIRTSPTMDYADGLLNASPALEAVWKPNAYSNGATQNGLTLYCQIKVQEKP